MSGDWFSDLAAMWFSWLYGLLTGVLLGIAGMIVVSHFRRNARGHAAAIYEPVGYVLGDNTYVYLSNAGSLKAGDPVYAHPTRREGQQ